jgi:ubiquinone/menaquinone biosynthesis C-methylase UbiE
MNNNLVDFEFVANSFSDRNIVSVYSNAALKVGLWGSEKIIFSKYFENSDDILVVGCGAGRVPIGIYKMGITSVEGLDITQAMIDSAREIVTQLGYNIPFSVGNAIALPFDESRFSGVILPYNVLMHIPGANNRIKALEQIYRVLIQNGYLIFTTHNDRYSNEIYHTFWEEEKKRWNTSTQDVRLVEYGDRFVEDKNSVIYMHFSTHEEVTESLKSVGFSVVDSFMRSALCNESEIVKNFSDDCRFWIAKKLG